MITPVVKENRVVFGPVRLSYTHLFSKYSPDDDSANGKYMTNVLIPKEEKETIAAIKQAIEAGKKQAIVSKWGGKEPKKLDLPLRDGDVDKEDDDVYAGHYFVNAKCNTRPGIVDKYKAPIVDEDEIYSGVWAIVSVTSPIPRASMPSTWVMRCIWPCMPSSPTALTPIPSWLLTALSSTPPAS